VLVSLASITQQLAVRNSDDKRKEGVKKCCAGDDVIVHYFTYTTIAPFSDDLFYLRILSSTS
jgi:hypothetical protein